MAGWRDMVTKQARTDMDRLTAAAMDLALQQVAADGGFLPFALAVSTEGETQVIQPDYPRDVELGADELTEANWGVLSRMSTGLRAALVSVDVNLPDNGKDGIELLVEHREGIALNIVFPYARSTDGEYDVDPPTVSSAATRVWSPTRA